MRSVFRRAIRAVFPRRLILPYHYYSLQLRRRLDEELVHIGSWLPRGKCAIDVGANIGLYSFALSKHFEKVEAFEPIFECAAVLSAYRASNITVHRVGLSSYSGVGALRVPVIDGVRQTALASLERREGYTGDTQTVELRRLDDYHFRDVCFIKIDAEGHELDVLSGARATISSYRPFLLVEVEQRHHSEPMNAVLEEIQSLGYEGFFWLHGKMNALTLFRYELHQEPLISDVSNKHYVNNFIFVPRERKQ